MAVTYCTAAQVAAFLQTAAFSVSTTPTTAQVEEFINENEDHIDEQTMHAWRSVTVTEETHHLEYPAYRRYEGTEIFLNHRKVKTLASGSGDKLEVWNGSTWEDYLVTRTEGRDEDFWVDYQMGVIFIRTYPQYNKRNFNVRVTYRYGETTVPADIRKACIRLTAVDILQGDDRSILVPEGSSNIPLVDKTEIWQNAADKIIQSRREMLVAAL